MEKKNQNFESNLEELYTILEKLESGDLTLDESIKEYEKAMKLIKKSSDVLRAAQGKILKLDDSKNFSEFGEE